MNKSIRTKLSKMDAEKLIEIIDLLCDDKTAEKKLSLLVNSSSADIDKALNEFDSLCERYRDNPDSESIAKRLYASADRLFAVADKVAVVPEAQIYCGVIDAYQTNDIGELCDDWLNDYLRDAVEGLKLLLKDKENELPRDKLEEYREAVDDYSD